MAHVSWKQEFDRKYRKLRNSGDVHIINDANDVLLRGLAGLDRIIKKTTRVTSRGKRS